MAALAHTLAARRVAPARPGFVDTLREPAHDLIVRTTPEEAGRQLEDQGHRLTAPRRAVLHAITANGEPFTIEDLCAAAPDVGRATVFRTVKLLQETEVICRLPMDDGGVRYQLSHGGHHHHLICNSCGTVDEFSDSELDGLINRNASEHGFEVSGHSLELYGRCAACLASAAQAETVSARRA